MQSCDGELKMQEAQIIRGLLLPANQQAARAVGPRVRSFYNPAARFAASASRRRGALAFAGNMNDVSSTLSAASHRLRVVTLIRAKMLLVTPFRRWTLYGNAFKRFCDQLLIVHICAGDGNRDRHTVPLRQHRPLDAQLASICWVFPGFFPHPVAPWSSPRPNFATASRFPSTRRTHPEHAARVFGIHRVEPILESTREWRCPNRIAAASPSTDNQSVAHTQFPSRHFAKAAAVARLCNSVCKLGGAA